MTIRIPDFRAYSCLENCVPKYSFLIQRRWPHSAEYEATGWWQSLQDDLSAVWEFIYHTPILNKGLRDDLEFLQSLAQACQQMEEKTHA